LGELQKLVQQADLEVLRLFVILGHKPLFECHVHIQLDFAKRYFFQTSFHFFCFVSCRCWNFQVFIDQLKQFGYLWLINNILANDLKQDDQEVHLRVIISLKIMLDQLVSCFDTSSFKDSFEIINLEYRLDISKLLAWVIHRLHQQFKCMQLTLLT